MGKRTPLFEIHKAYQEHIFDIVGWEMPIYYTGTIAEHETVREGVGLFDVSHMGKIEVRGKGALINLQKLLISNTQNISIYQVKYSNLCYSDGGVIDDVTVNRLAEDRFLLCVNASSTEKDYRWISQNLEGELEAIDQSHAFAQLAVQGPKSFELFQKLTPINLRKIKFYWFVLGTLDAVQAIISRTAYSGEEGFEHYFSPEYATHIWEPVMTEGKQFGIKPVGLAARDTLRLEMGYPLYGHELNRTNKPL